MKYQCLVFDHDDTVVNSTATIHQPCFQAYLDVYYPGRTCSTEEYFLKNFDPGFLQMCVQDYGMTDRDLEIETEFWFRYVKDHTPRAYEGIRGIMERHKAMGGRIAVISHSFSNYILRDYETNGLPAPDAVYGWDSPPEHRKPSPFPLQDLMHRFDLKPEEMLVIDDLKPGFDMAERCGVDFAAAGWANDIPGIETFMRANCRHYFKTVPELSDFIFGENK